VDVFGPCGAVRIRPHQRSTGQAQGLCSIKCPCGAVHRPSWAVYRLGPLGLGSPDAPPHGGPLPWSGTGHLTKRISSRYWTMSTIHPSRQSRCTPLQYHTVVYSMHSFSCSACYRQMRCGSSPMGTVPA
jgi:hypothetical protein